ncbi:MAG: choice-of-anchor tandem repeat GloVer-containing protein [Candidatus Korobacteraceae bacterium]
MTVLHLFNGRPDGREPIAGVTMDAAGNLYGTTYYGGANDVGLVYKLAHRGSGWVLSPLYSFQQGQGAGGFAPIGGVTFGSDGNLYGTTSRGGQNDVGTVYKLSPPATVCKSVLCPWTETPLYQFTDGADGGYPEGTLIFDSAGNLYGTATAGGTGDNGVVFKLTHSGSGWTESVLHSFTGSPDGSGPLSAVTFDNSGNLYGTTLEGGTADDGTVYQLTPSGSGWTEEVIYAFQGSNDGAFPYAGVVLDPEGNLYGATFYDGAYNGGAVFELMPSNGNWIFSVLYSPDVEDGGAAGTLARSSNGTLYGTLFSGGGQNCSGYGCGSVFQLSPSNGGWEYTSLYNLNNLNDGGDGGNPEGQLIFDSAGNLYGTTTGALGGDGFVFEVTP